MQCYGFWHLISLVNLEKVGLLYTYKQKKGLDFEYMKKKLKLINCEDEKEACFAYSGFCPLSMRLIENALKPKHWNNIYDILKRIPGAIKYDTKFSWDFESGSGRKK